MIHIDTDKTGLSDKEVSKIIRSHHGNADLCTYRCYDQIYHSAVAVLYHFDSVRYIVFTLFVFMSVYDLSSTMPGLWNNDVNVRNQSQAR